MADYRGASFARHSRVGLMKTSGWDALATSSFFTPDPPDEAHNTFNDLTSTASGSHTVGTGSATLDALTSSGAGASGAKGTSAATLSAATSTASGSTVRGTSAATLSAATSSSTGTAAGGSSAVTLAALTSSASGARGAAGTSAPTLATSTSSASGTIPATGSAATTLEALTTLGTDAPDPVTIIFDDGTIPADLYWSSAGAGSVIDRPDATGGTTKALRYPDIDDSEESYFEIFATSRPGNNFLTVRYEVSSESGYDYWRIYIDDVERWEEAGTGAGWSEVGFELTVGLHTIKFRYSKDSSADEGDDTAYISKIIVSPIGERPVTAATTLEDLTSQADGTHPDYPGWRYWRFWSLATQSISGSTGLGEVELRGSIGGADLTGPGIGTATQTHGTPNGGYPAANAFDDNLATGWQTGSSFAVLQYEFTNYPVEVAQISHKQVLRGEMMDMRVERSKDGSTWEDAAIKRGILTWPDSGLPPTYFVSGTETLIRLTGPVRDYDGYIGINGFGRTDRYIEFCPENKVAITGYSIPFPIVIERFIAYSAAPLPSPPIGATTYTFKIRGVIYGSNVSNVPQTLIAVTAERTSVPNDWFELELAEPLRLAPGFYHFGVHVGGTSGGITSRDTFGAAVSVKTLLDFPYDDGPPDPFPILTSGAVVQSQAHPIYVIYPVVVGASTLASATSTAVGLVNAQPITGTAAAELAELASDAIGGSTIGAASISLEAMLSDATGARGVFRPRQSLYGTYRPNLSLNATWVER